MPAFLVRHVKDKPLVGIFSALLSDELPVLVDECTNGDCEFVIMPSGGIMWPDPTMTIPSP